MKNLLVTIILGACSSVAISQSVFSKVALSTNPGDHVMESNSVVNNSGNIVSIGALFQNGSKHGYLADFDQNGNLLNSYKFDVGSQFQFNSIEEYSNGDYLLAGNVNSNGIHYLKVNSTGDVLWNKSFVPGFSTSVNQSSEEVLVDGTDAYLAFASRSQTAQV